MSSATTAVAPADAVTVAETVAKPPRRFPPPCWTQEETLALIEAYRERWYALRRGYLRTADWDAVAAAVACRYPDASPAKTSAQCRHKMEKLRQRYRAEKQRALSFPYPAGRYFSSWFFFENMEAMENGTTPPTAVQKPENSGDGSQLKSFLDQNILKLKLRANNPDPDSVPGSGFDNNAVKPKRFNTEYSPYTDVQAVDKEEEEEDMPQDEHLTSFQRRNGNPKPPSKPKSKRAGKMFDNINVGGGFHQDILPPGLRIKKFGNFDPNMNSGHSNEELWAKISNKNIENTIDNRAKYWSSLNAGPDSRSGPAFKRGRNPLEDIVASIKLLGEGFVKMERAKMEMAREMEAMRMEMEMKRNEMLLESQKQIVDALLKGMFELKKSKKVKTGGAAADSA